MENNIFTRNFIDKFILRTASAFLFFAVAALFCSSEIFAAPGDWDASFGTDGKAILTGTLGNVYAAALQPDGKIVLVGDYETGGVNKQWLIGRLNADGTPDATFGGDGFVILPISAQYERDVARAVFVRADGKILVAGTQRTENIITLAIFNSDGTLAASLKQRSGVADKRYEVGGMAETPDGKIVIVGSVIYPDSPTHRTMFAARHLANGGIDLLFGSLETKNIVELPVPVESVGAKAVAALPDGNIVIAGSSYYPNRSVYVVKMKPDGSLAAFGASNYASFNYSPNEYSGEANAIAIQTNGRIVVAGESTEAVTQNGIQSSFGIARLSASGFLDSTFQGGKVRAEFTNYADRATGVAVQPDGKIVASGVAGLTGTSAFTQIAVARYNSDGSPDATFGGAGRLMSNDIPYGSSGSAIALQTDGKIVIAGNVTGLPGARRLIGGNGGGNPINFNKTRGDFDGDHRADIAVFRPSNGTWWTMRSASGQAQAQQFGSSGDIPATGDFDGDNKTDVAVFRPSNGTWHILQSSNNQYRAAQFGLNGDTPVASDYDGDGKADIAVFRPSDGIWYVLKSSNNQVQTSQFGLNGDVPVTGDFDKDGKTDFAVFRPSNGTWYVLNSAGGVKIVQFGLSGDVPQIGDYDGDAAADYAVFRPTTGAWYVLRSSNNQMQAATFGTNGDQPAARDYDGDGKTDYAVYRPSNGTWHLLQTSNQYAAVQFGTSGDFVGN